MRLNLVTLLLAVAILGYGGFYLVTTHQQWTPLRIIALILVVPSTVMFMTARIQPAKTWF